MTRAGIEAVSRKLESGIAAIVGLRGTSSSTLELLSETLVERIAPIDGNQVEQHNAFRSPE